MTAPVWETLNLSSKCSSPLSACFNTGKISQRQENSGEFRKIKLYGAFMPIHIIAFVDFVTGRIQIETRIFNISSKTYKTVIVKIFSSIR